MKNKIECNNRLEFPEDESRHSWLSNLLEGYDITNQGVAEAIRRETLQGRTLACGKGCAACCRTHTTIPVYPLELVGIAWFATEQVKGAQREVLKHNLTNHHSGEACPFLVNDVCSIHPLRPMACRQFNVFGQVCEEEEDAYYTRRNDVMKPLKEYTDEAFLRMMPFYGVTKKSEQKKAVKNGEIHQVVRVLQEIEWRGLAEKMEKFDTHHSGE